MDHRKRCSGRCSVCHKRSCIQGHNHPGPHYCRAHNSQLLNQIFSTATLTGDKALAHWLGDTP